MRALKELYSLVVNKIVDTKAIVVNDDSKISSNPKIADNSSEEEREELRLDHHFKRTLDRVVSSSSNILGKYAATKIRKFGNRNLSMRSPKKF